MEKDGNGQLRKFSAEYSAETAQLIQCGGKSIREIAQELGIGETALRSWVEKAEVEAGCWREGDLKRNKREELVQLRHLGVAEKETPPLVSP